MLCVAVHPSGNAFVTGSSDSKVRLFDLQSRTCAQIVAEHNDQVSGPAVPSSDDSVACRRLPHIMFCSA